MILSNFFSKQNDWLVKGETASVDFDSMVEFSAEKSSQLPDEPIEEGSFATYNRVISPRTISCRLAVKGGASDLQNAIDRLTDMAEDVEKITLTTPEQSYENMMLESFDYRRDSNNGRGVLYVDLRFKEIREVASAQTTTAVEEQEEMDAEDCEDGSCADDVDGGEVQGSSASEAEAENANEGKRTSVLADILN